MPVIYDIGEGDNCPLSDPDEMNQFEETESSTDSEDTPATCSARNSLNREPMSSPLEEVPVEKSRIKEKLDFCLTGLSLSISATALMTIYPVYLRSVMTVSNSFVALLFPSTTCFFTLLLLTVLLNWIGYFNGFPMTRCPLPMKRLSVGALSYAVGCSLVVLAQLPNRVPCHLQDPLKAVIIIFSLLYYFFFCKKMLGLKKLFAAAVLAVGLFIAADYGLCDEFKCRGTQSHIEGNWEARAGWTLLYLAGLGLFTLHFTLTEEFISNRPLIALYLSLSGSFLATISRLVSHNESCDQTYTTNTNSSQNLVIQENDKNTLRSQDKNNKRLCLLTTVWIQGVTWLFVLISGLLIGIMSNSLALYVPSESLMNATVGGLLCHVPRLNLKESVEHLVSTLPIDVNSVTDYPILNLKDLHGNDDSVSQTKKQHFLDNMHLLEEKNKIQFTKKMLDAKYTDTNIKMNEPKLDYKISLKGKYNKIENSNLSSKYKKKHNDTFASSMDNETRMKLLNEIFNITRKRVKRNAVESLPFGFKVIQPTISILKDHIITSKIKPYLIGHVILNITNANLKGHKIAINRDYYKTNADAAKLPYDRIGRQRTKINEFKISNSSRPSNALNATKSHKPGKKKSNTGKTATAVDLSKKDRKTSKEMRFKRIKRFTNMTKLENQETIDADKILNDGKNTEIKHGNDSKNLNINLKEANVHNTKNKMINHVNTNYIYKITKLNKNDCNHISTYGWTVFLANIIFSVSSLRFLKLCQSSVFTIAMMTPALPLTGIWWAIFTYNSDGSIVMEPTMSGELICALLSFPIILLGLALLFKAQLNQPFWSVHSEHVVGGDIFSFSRDINLNKSPSSENNAEYELGRRPQA